MQAGGKVVYDGYANYRIYAGRPLQHQGREGAGLLKVARTMGFPMGDRPKHAAGMSKWFGLSGGNIIYSLPLSPGIADILGTSAIYGRGDGCQAQSSPEMVPSGDD